MCRVTIVTKLCRLLIDSTGLRLELGHISILGQVITNKKYQPLHQSNYFQCFLVELPYNNTFVNRFESAFCALRCAQLIFNMIVCRYSYMIPRDGKFGNRDKYGNWSGIVREVMEKVGSNYTSNSKPKLQKQNSFYLFLCP